MFHHTCEQVQLLMCWRLLPTFLPQQTIEELYRDRLSASLWLKCRHNLASSLAQQIKGVANVSPKLNAAACNAKACKVLCVSSYGLVTASACLKNYAMFQHINELFTRSHVSVIFKPKFEQLAFASKMQL